MIPDNLRKYDYRENLIVDQDNPVLIQKAWRDRFSAKSHWISGYGGMAYLSRPNSEDALTWNVFRFLQLSGKEGLQIVSEIFGISKVERMLFWGCDVEHWGEEQQLLNILIRVIDGKFQGTMTEPDLVVITDREVVFVECKLNLGGRSSPWRAQSRGAEKRFREYLKLFPEIEHVPDWRCVYQLIRQYVFSRSMAECLGKSAAVVPVINEKHRDVLFPHYMKVRESPINKDGVFREFVTWQKILSILSASDLKNREIVVRKISEALSYSR